MDPRPSPRSPASRAQLPFPPTVNKYWRPSVRHGYLTMKLTAVARDYRTRVSIALIEQRVRPDRYPGRVRLELVAFPPDRRIRDLDNLLKAPLDALRAFGLFLDDSQIDELLVQRGAVTPPGHIDVCVQKLEAAL